MNIRKAAPADLSACANVNIQSEKRGASIRRARKHLTLKYLRRRLADETCTFLVAEQSDRVIGYIVCKHDKWNSSIYIEELFVRQDSQHKGVGSALLTAAEKYAQTRRARAIFLDTRKENNKALQFYKKHGFSIAGHINGLYNERHGDALVLSRRVKRK